LIVAMLRASTQPMTVVDIAENLRVHPNTVRFHLDSLVDTGRVERLLGDSNGPGRPPVVYQMSRAMDRNGPTNYRLLATMLTAHLAASARNPAKMATDLGRTWGPSIVDVAGVRARSTKTQALSDMVDVLADLGFEPEPHRGTRTTQIRLRHCPFLDLVDEHADVVCSLHLGLMQGAFAALKAPVTAERLEPFVEPDLCVAHLAPSNATTNPPTNASVSGFTRRRR
jgi:predicted ArsR family transcriptional regulator